MKFFVVLGVIGGALFALGCLYLFGMSGEPRLLFGSALGIGAVVMGILLIKWS